MSENTCQIYIYKKPAKQSVSIGAVVAEAGSTAHSKTSGWRTLRPEIDRAKCIKCHQCWQFCPDMAVDLNVDVNYDYCKGCGICMKQCPVKAIRMVEEQK